MGGYGHALRLRRLFPPDGRNLFAVPLDHSVSMGPIDGLESTAATVAALREGGADLVIVTKGAVREVVPEIGERMRLGVHLSASTALGPAPDLKVLVGTAHEAAALGADLVSVQVNFGTEGEAAMLEGLGRISEECRAAGLPLLCMSYVKRPGPIDVGAIQHACRAAADLGADIVKTAYPGSPEALRAVVRSTPVPVLLGGGLRLGGEAEALGLIDSALRAGARGICIGRNLFQQAPLEPFVRRVSAMVHGSA